MRRRTDLLVTMVVICSLFVMGCSGGGSSSGSGGGDSGGAVNVSGTWKGTGTSPQTGPAPTTLILNQNGSNVSGTWDGYAVTGTLSGDQLTLTFTPFTQSGVSFTGGGRATVSGNNMSGTMSLTGRYGGSSATVNGTFTATRSGSNLASIADQAPTGGLVGAAVGAMAK